MHTEGTKQYSSGFEYFGWPTIMRINKSYAYSHVMAKKNKKLTLYLDEEVIRQAKEQAQRSGTSVSDMVEKYLSEKTGISNQSNRDEMKDDSISAEFVEFYGVVRVPDDFDEKKTLRDHRLDRHRLPESA